MKHSFARYPLQEIFAAPSHIAILRVLEPLMHGLSGRELARRANINDRTCRLALERLEAINIVQNIGSGKTKLFQLNREHYSMGPVLSQLFSEERRFFPAVQARIKNVLEGKCVWACLYGSVVKQEDTKDSDLDVLILIKDDADPDKVETLVAGLIPKLYQVYGLSISPIILTIHQWQEDTQYHVLKAEIQRDHIDLIGSDPT